MVILIIYQREKGGVGGGRITLVGNNENIKLELPRT